MYDLSGFQYGQWQTPGMRVFLALMADSFEHHQLTADFNHPQNAQFFSAYIFLTFAIWLAFIVIPS